MKADIYKAAHYKIQEPSCIKATLKMNKMGRLRVPVLKIKYKEIVTKAESYPQSQGHLEKKEQSCRYHNARFQGITKIN